MPSGLDNSMLNSPFSPCDRLAIGLRNASLTPPPSPPKLRHQQPLMRATSHSELRPQDHAQPYITRSPPQDSMTHSTDIEQQDHQQPDFTMPAHTTQGEHLAAIKSALAAHPQFKPVSDITSSRALNQICWHASCIDEYRECLVETKERMKKLEARIAPRKTKLLERSRKLLEQKCEISVLVSRSCSRLFMHFLHSYAPPFPRSLLPTSRSPSVRRWLMSLTTNLGA